MPEFRLHHQQDIDLMPYREIAEKMGMSHAASAKYTLEAAFRKLRKRYTLEQLRELYAPDPENTQPLSKIGSQWKVSELRPVELHVGRKIK